MGLLLLLTTIHILFLGVNILLAPCHCSNSRLELFHCYFGKVMIELYLQKPLKKF